MDYTCKICGTTVSKRQSLAFEDGRVCRIHSEEIESKKKEKENRLNKIKYDILFNVITESQFKETIDELRRFEIEQFNKTVHVMKAQYDVNNEISASSLYYNTEECNKILNDIKYNVAKEICQNAEAFRAVCDIVYLDKIFVGEKDNTLLVKKLREVWYSMNCHTVKPLSAADILDGYINASFFCYLEKDSEMYKEILNELINKGPLNSKLEAIGAFLWFKEKLDKFNEKISSAN